MQAEQMRRCPGCRAKVPAFNPELPHSAFCPECGCEIAAGKPDKANDLPQRMPLFENTEAAQPSDPARADDRAGGAGGSDGNAEEDASPKQKKSGWLTTVLWVVITLALLGWKAYNERKAPAKSDRPTQQQQRQYPSRP